MTTAYLKPLFSCFVLSVVLLVLLTLLDSPPWLTIGSAVSPLIAYHWAYLKPRAKSGLTQGAIDTVYYYGFLLTIVSLGITGISISFSKETEPEKLLSTVGAQFGLGLLATAYAVGARVHLTAISTAVSHGSSPEDGFNQIVDKSFTLAGNIETAALRFEKLATALQERTDHTVSAATDTFAASLNEVTAQMKADLAEIRATLQDSAFADHRRVLRKSLDELGTAAEHLAQNMKHLSEASNSEASAALQLAANSLKLNAQMSALTASLESISGTSGVAARTVRSLNELSINLAAHSERVFTLTEQLQAIEEHASSALPTFKNIRSTSKKVSEQVDSLSAASVNLEGVINRFSRTSEGVDGLTDQVRSAVAALGLFTTNLSELQQKTQGLVATSAEASKSLEVEIQKLPQIYARVQSPVTVATDTLTRDINKWSGELAADLDRSKKAVEMLQDKLISLTQHIIDHVKDQPPHEATNR